jgi:hypothetical protein
MNTKPLLIGLNNPLSPRPRDALVPWPRGCAGARLVEYTQLAAPDFTTDEYLDAFERRNLWPGRELPRGRGATNLLLREGRSLLAECVSAPRTVVLLGAKVWYCVLSRTPPQSFDYQHVHGSTFWYVPHPSGLNRAYNDHANRARTGAVLLSLARPKRLRIVGGRA